ncbi:MAG: HAMP domain-containing histidine kinase [Chitinophagaceae bacterium]|nr:MAG: HAMP domain-containing histidine kinase [Chitinophagaceae bacterium]
MTGTQEQDFPRKRVLLLAAAALLFLSFITTLYFHEQPSMEREQRRLERYLHNAEDRFGQVLENKGLVQRLLLQQETGAEFTSMLAEPFGLFLYQGGQMRYWNSQRMLPPPSIVGGRNGNQFVSLPNGYFVTLRRTVSVPASRSPVTVIAVVPILYRYEYNHSSYLKTAFAHDPEAYKRIRVAAGASPYTIRDKSTQKLFHIAPRNDLPGDGPDAVSSILRLLAFIMLLAYFHFVAERVTRNRGPLRGIAFLFVTLLAVRILLLLLPGLFSLRQFTLFDPKIYGNFYNPFFRSLGDLLITALFGCWLTVFTWYQMGPDGRLPAFLSGRRRLLWGALAALFLLMWGSFQFANVVRSLVADSIISFNVIDFFSLDVYSVAGFLVLALLTLTYYYFTRVLYRVIFPAFAGHMVYLYFALALMGLVFLTLRTGNEVVLFHLPVLLWLLCYTAVVSRSQFFINRFRISVAGALFWIFVFSLSLAIVILGENRKKDFEKRQAIAAKFDALTDPSGEHTLSMSLVYLDNDYLAANFPRFRDPQQSRLLRDSIISENIMGALNRYNTRIFVFDANNDPVNNTDGATFTELNNLYSVQSKPTSVRDLSYYETSYNEFTYITRRRVTDTSGTLGTFYIVSTPKKYNSEALYPELFRSTGESDSENSPYAFAIYKNRLLVRSSNKYSFRISLALAELPQTEYERRQNGAYDELWYRASGNKVVVIAKKRDTLLESITLFSYLFCAFLFLVGILRLLLFLLRAGETWHRRSLWQLNIRTQVHSTIIFISIFSFVVIGAATISFFVNRYQRNNMERLSRTAGIVVKEMQQRVLADKPIGASLSEEDSVGSLQALVNEVAEIHNVDVNLYDPSGGLQLSSEPEVYKRGLLSTRMHPMAWHHLSRMREVQYVQEESLSSLRYMSIYAAITNKKGEVYAYLNVPYFLSQIDLNQEISNFLVTIINLNAFIFLIAGIIALFITNRITESFLLIGEKMRAISLGQQNEEIEWPRNDEIGVLVEQYNRMVRQLGESATALARSEREGAWREMARQVAHEIKNPLTPMKLSIQYLQRAVNTNQPNVQQLTTSVAQTLIEQIDHLAKISSDFARFANIGNGRPETFDLHTVLQSLEGLYVTNPKVAFEWKRLPEPLLVHADRTHMVRLFTNLLTNAVEACAERPDCRIGVAEQHIGGRLRVSVADNGEGIPEEMRDRLFTPNFTTKTSGTGLGLAMCKSIAEQAGGRIWFETERGVGTTFFVELPLAGDAEEG